MYVKVDGRFFSVRFFRLSDFLPRGKCPIISRSKTPDDIYAEYFFAGSWMHLPDFLNEIRNNPPNSKPNSNQFLRLFYTTPAGINTCCNYTHNDRPFIIEPTANIALRELRSNLPAPSVDSPALVGLFLLRRGGRAARFVYLCNNLCPVYLSPCRSTHKFSSQSVYTTCITTPLKQTLLQTAGGRSDHLFFELRSRFGAHPIRTISNRTGAQLRFSPAFAATPWRSCPVKCFRVYSAFKSFEEIMRNG
jgi:hypothetical protein